MTTITVKKHKRKGRVVRSHKRKKPTAIVIPNIPGKNEANGKPYFDSPYATETQSI